MVNVGLAVVLGWVCLLPAHAFQATERASVPNAMERDVLCWHKSENSELGGLLLHVSRWTSGAFKTPTLRDVELTSPYMHNGSLKTLIEVVQFYNRGGRPNSNLDKVMEPLQLSDNEVKAPWRRACIVL